MITTSRTNTTLAGAGLMALFVSSMLVGCGYTHKELFPRQYQTVAAPVFKNDTFYRGVEFDLGEALVKQIETRTPYKVVSSPTADTLLRGAITNIEQTTLSRRRQGGVPQELEVVVQVNFQWTDQRTGETIRARRGFQAVGRYVPSKPVGQPLELAQHQAVEQLAHDIVTTMAAGW